MEIFLAKIGASTTMSAFEKTVNGNFPCENFESYTANNPRFNCGSMKRIFASPPRPEGPNGIVRMLSERALLTLHPGQSRRRCAINDQL